MLCASIGSIQVTEAIKLLTGIGEPLLGRLMIYDALDMNYRTVKVRKDPNCAVCGTNPTVTELIDYEAFCGAVSEEASEAVRGSTISVTELADMLEERESGDRDFLLIDVREPAEWEIVAIPGAQLIPKGEFLSGAALADLPQHKPIVVHCKSGDPLGGGSGRAQGRRVRRRGARRRRDRRLGQPDRAGQAQLLTAASLFRDGRLTRRLSPALSAFRALLHRLTQGTLKLEVYAFNRGVLGVRSLRRSVSDRKVRAGGLRTLLERDRGAVAVEAALIFPILILLAFGAIEWGAYLRTFNEVVSVARAGARTGASLAPAYGGSPRVAIIPAPITQTVMQSVQSAASALPNDAIEYILIYQANADGFPGLPANRTMTCSVMDTTCDRYTWDTLSNTFKPTVGSTWTGSAINSCLGATENGQSIGVYVQAKYRSITPLFGSERSIGTRTVMKFEPRPPGSCKP